MKVFVTGATGLVGTALIPKLVAAGHSVVGLARSQASIAKLEKAGVKGVEGSIEDLEVCAKAAGEAEVVVHLAFDHAMAFSGDFPGACEKDRAVIKAMCDALVASKGSTEPFFMVTSGTLGLIGEDEFSDSHKSPHMPRYLSTELAFSYVPKGLRVVQMRLAPITYGPEKPHEFLSMPVPKYKELGNVLYPESTNAWSACNVEDCADLYVLTIAAKDKLPNPCALHGLGEYGVPMKEVAEVLGAKLNLPIKAVPPQELPQHFGFGGVLMTMARPAKADWTKQVTGWKPTGKGLIATLREYNI